LLSAAGGGELLSIPITTPMKTPIINNTMTAITIVLVELVFS